MTSPEDVRFKMLQSAPLDKWIAFSEDESRIVAIGSTYNEAAEQSEKAGVVDPVIFKTPSAWAPFSV